MRKNSRSFARSIRYGNMVHNVLAIDAILANGNSAHFADLAHTTQDAGCAELVQKITELGQREASEIAKKFPQLLRRVGGYNINEIADTETCNFARLLVGSEGTLAFFTRLKLELQPIPPHRVLGVCHFPNFHQAMDSTQIVRDSGSNSLK